MARRRPRALAAWVLTRAGLDPGFFVGGVPLNFGSGWNAGTGEHVVLEGDEYDTAFFDKGPKFLHYRPKHVILDQRRVRPRRYLPRSRLM